MLVLNFVCIDIILSTQIEKFNSSFHRSSKINLKYVISSELLGIPSNYFYFIFSDVFHVIYLNCRNCYLFFISYQLSLIEYFIQVYTFKTISCALHIMCLISVMVMVLIMV